MHLAKAEGIRDIEEETGYLEYRNMDSVKEWSEHQWRPYQWKSAQGRNLVVIGGPFAGEQVVGIGPNKKERVRVSNLALAVHLASKKKRGSAAS